jgi:hypothetical protein
MPYCAVVAAAHPYQSPTLEELHRAVHHPSFSAGPRRVGAFLERVIVAGWSTITMATMASAAISTARR